jgi:ketosteroid isomerase-like protein
MRGVSLFTLEDGRVVRLVLFTDWDAAREAAGLSE